MALHKMSKKGVALPLETIAIIILVLLVLIVLSVAFREQITDLFSSFKNLITGTTDTINNLDIEKTINTK